jgi:hypothetical protein
MKLYSYDLKDTSDNSLSPLNRANSHTFLMILPTAKLLKKHLLKVKENSGRLQKMQMI